MWIEMVKDALGLKSGQRVDVSDADAKHLIEIGAAKPCADQASEIIGKGLAEGMAKIHQGLNEAIDKALKAFAETQTKSLDTRRKVLFGPSGDGDPQKPTFGKFLCAIRAGDVKSLEAMGSKFASWNGDVGQKSTLLAQTGSLGGYTVPTEFLPRLLGIASETAIVESLATVIPMATQEIQIPALNVTTAPTAGETALFGGVQVSWTEEGSALSEKNPTFKQISLRSHELSGYTYAGNSLLADDGIGLEAILVKLFGMAIAWHKDYAFLRGSGVGRPLGILNSGSLISVTRSGASGFTLADASGMVARLLPPADRSKVAWVMSPGVQAKLFQMVSSSTGGQVVMIDNARDQPVMTLFGYPIKVTEKLPALGTLGDVMLCDFMHYLIGNRQQAEIAYSEHYRFTNNQGTWRFVARCDGQPWMGAAVTLSDASSTLSPFVALAA